MPDEHDLERFVTAQARDYDRAMTEIRAGQKRSHWMWYIFPQLDGLGLSPTSKRYAIRGLDEARAFLRHPILGPRLQDSCEAVLAITGQSAATVFGEIDAMKLRSCATLFAVVSPPESVFARVLERYFHSAPDEQTQHVLAR